MRLVAACSTCVARSSRTHLPAPVLTIVTPGACTRCLSAKLLDRHRLDSVWASEVVDEALPVTRFGCLRLLRFPPSSASSLPHDPTTSDLFPTASLA